MMKNIATLTCLLLSCLISLAAVVVVHAADSPLLPPSLRQASQQTTQAEPVELNASDAENYRQFQEWQKTKGAANADYQEFLLWLEFQEQQHQQQQQQQKTQSK